MTESVRDIVFSLEQPIFEARSLTHALMMMGSSDDMRGESGQAVAVVAATLLGYLEEIQGAWEALSNATRGEQAASKPTVKGRALHVVDADEGGAA